MPQYAEDLYATAARASGSDAAGQGDRKEYNFIFAGNIGDMQSVETIIQAANELTAWPAIRFHLVGDGSKLDACKKLADKLGLANVTFYGRQPVTEMPRFYGLADAMLVTLQANRMLSYTLPGKVQSYMAAGKPIIGAINGETSQVISQSGCGFCCAAGDYKEFATLILRFSQSDDKEQMAARSRQFYDEHYRKSRFFMELEAALDRLRKAG